MKAATPELDALLAGNQFRMADLYTFTLVSGTVLRYTGADVDLGWNGGTFLCDDVLWRRGRIRWSRGVEVDTLDLTAYADGSHLVEGVPFLRACREGAFDGATLLLERAFLSAWPTVVGTLIQFPGRVSDVGPFGRGEAEFKVASDLELLNVKIPRNLYQAGCLHTVYDGNCAANKAAVTVSGYAAAGATVKSMPTTLVQADGWFNQGVVAFTSGALAGCRRTVKSYAVGVVSFIHPLPAAPATNDAFTIYPGCDKAQATCSAKFNNLARFRGYPFIPVPETAL